MANRTEDEWKKLFKSQGITAKKVGGDDCYSWAVLKRGRVIVNGCSRSEANYYKKLAVKEV